MSLPNWAVLSATPREDYTLYLEFADGTHRIYDATPLLSRKAFARLKSLPYFMKAHASFDTVAWDEETDIAPEHLYEESSVVGLN